MKKSGSSKSAPAKRVSAKTRADDDKLRAELRNADMKKFDRVLGKAIRSATTR